MDENNKLEKGVKMAAAFVAWLFITIFVMIGMFQLTTVVLGWYPVVSGVIFFIAALIMFIGPPVMIANALEEPNKKLEIKGGND